MKTQPNKSLQTGAFLIATALVSLADVAQAQQPFTMPTALGTLATSSGNLGEPIDAVGVRVLARTPSPNESIGTYSTESTQGPQFYSAFVSGATAAAIDDPRLERGQASPTRFFCTEVVNGLRTLRSRTIGGATSITTLGSNYRLAAVAQGNSRFALRSSTGQVAVYDATLTPTFQVVATVANAQDISFSPNGTAVAFRVPGSTPFAAGSVYSTVIGSGIVTQELNGVLRSKPVWLDDQFLAVVELDSGTSRNRLRRIDTAGPEVFLTDSTVNIETANDLSISDDHQYLTFVAAQTVNGNVERVPVAMPCSSDAINTNGPGGASIVIGDYRWAFNAPASLALTTWQFLGRPVITNHMTGAIRNTRVLWHGRRTTGAVEVFRADITDDPRVQSRGVMGSNVQIRATAPPFATLWSVQASYVRSSQQNSFLPQALNAQLLDNPVTVFTASASTQAVQITLPNDPTLSGLIRLMFQTVWFDSQTDPHFSHVAEYALF